MQNKPRLSFWQIWNMSFGFLGIQFGWGLQLANMSAIYTKLGANPDDVPILWLAGPVTGLLVQPIIGSLSDRTWNWLGRRRPYFTVGAILSSIALFIMPDSAALWMAATLLWILDASINVSMEPFRAFVADKLNEDQRTTGFIMQAFFIGIGATLANALPIIFRNLGVEGNAPNGIPLTVYYSFKIGAAMFLLCVLYTVFTSKEYPPEDMEEFERKKKEAKAIRVEIEGVILKDDNKFQISALVIKESWFVKLKKFFDEIFDALKKMPATMKQLAVVQFFTWLGLFCMWMFYGLTTSYHVFKAPNKDSKLFDQGGEWGGWMFAIYSIVCFIVAFALPALAKNLGRKTTHAIALTLGGLGLLSMYFVESPNAQYLTMIGVGIAWASILAMPYAILSSALPPARMGVYMGVFNFFIVIPEIVASFTFGPIIKAVFGENSTTAPLYVVMAGGVFMLLAAIATILLVNDVSGAETVPISADEDEGLTVQQSAQPVPDSGLNE